MSYLKKQIDALSSHERVQLFEKLNSHISIAISLGKYLDSHLEEHRAEILDLLLLNTDIEMLAKLHNADDALIAADYEDKVDLYIIGGAAVSFHVEDFRGTMDIDVATRLDDVLKEILILFDINNNALATANLAEGYMDRSIHFDYFKCLNVFIASKVDLILTKIQRSDSVDGEDINQLLSVMDQEEKNLLLKLGDAMASYMSSNFKQDWAYYRRSL